MTAEQPDQKQWADTAAGKKFASKQYSEYFDPCQEAAARSLRCLHRNGGDRDMCSDYFQAYRDCKKEWVRKDRILPPHASPCAPTTDLTDCLDLHRRRHERKRSGRKANRFGELD
ncbi:uncharacterized protein K452DRAFT_249868, partial [Aplosporella prunicola CBS 121167]